MSYTSSTNKRIQNQLNQKFMKAIAVWITIGLMGAAIWFFIQGEWKIGLFTLAIDFVFSWICGYVMMKNER